MFRRGIEHADGKRKKRERPDATSSANSRVCRSTPTEWDGCRWHGVYYRLLLLGFFEGIDSERGIAWRAADSLSLRQFLHHGIDETTPDHVTISRTKRLIGEETQRQVFGWVLDNSFT